MVATCFGHSGPYAGQLIETKGTVSAYLCIMGSNITCFGVHAVAQLVEALRYNPEGRGFDSRWCHWNFSLT